MNSGFISKEEKLNQIKFRVDLKNLKSDYFLMKLFGIMKRNKSLKIMKINKNLQKRLNLSLNDYKNYAQLFSSIEIEIETDYIDYNENKKFINIPEEEKEYYHIYFDNSKEDIKRNYFKENDRAEIIKIIIDYQVKSFKKLFFNCKYIDKLTFTKFYRNNITDMSLMFYNCSPLNKLVLSSFNTENVTNMSFMFCKCSSLKELNLSNFNTDKVIDMSGMFRECSSLKKLNLSSFNTNNVINMSTMFFDCISLQELNLSNFNANNETNMYLMFGLCWSLKNINFPNFDTNNAKNIDDIFYNCGEELKMKFLEQNKNKKI